MRPDHVVDLAALMRRTHYAKLGAKALPWEQLTDAQKVPWILRAVGR